MHHFKQVQQHTLIIQLVWLQVDYEIKEESVCKSNLPYLNTYQPLFEPLDEISYKMDIQNLNILSVLFEHPYFI